MEGFRDTVITRFVESYKAGITPNPCIDCNRFMKFDKLFDRAEILECEYVVTGHYARIEKDGDKYLLKKAIDDTKDQSYVLYTMTQKQLAHTMFPLGSLAKSEVRKLANDNNFVNANKPDSQDICFVPDGNYVSFVERNMDKPSEEGDFIDKEGKVIGRHKGIIRYTIGQRKGLNIYSDRPLYVKKINPSDNTVTIVEDKDLYSNTLVAHSFNWISGNKPENSIRCNAKIRYRHKEAPALATVLEDDSVKIVFDEPQRAITPGQAVVIYDGDVVLGGGRISVS